jgi:hypothetical protein
MAEPAPKRAKGDINAQVRAALRAAERAEWIGNVCEIEFLKRQADEITRIQPIGKEEELLLIIQQLEQKAARDRKLAVTKANVRNSWTCSICMERLMLTDLCVNVPCGHGFCKACITKTAKPLAYHGAHAAAPSKSECFNCRTVVDSVVQTYV